MKYIGVLAILAGHLLWSKTVGMLVYSVVVFLAYHLFVAGYEKPTLRGMFGAAYEDYCRKVPSWVPRIRPDSLHSDID